jgi:UDP-N-acetylmuramoyl-tripeptide--D-alanyl-D-alanine ligase
MKALIENIETIPVRGKKIGVFGQMREQGVVSAQVHRDLGTLAGNSNFSVLFFVGEDSAAFEDGLKQSQFDGKSIISDTYKDSLASELASVLHKEDIAVIKGSRGMKMERFFLFCDPLDFNFNKESKV